MLLTPIAYALNHQAPNEKVRWGVTNGMSTAMEIQGYRQEEQRLKSLGVMDVSCYPRIGIKGPNAEAWLLEQGIPLPSEVNTWGRCGEFGVVLRLGASEFLFEDQTLNAEGVTTGWVHTLQLLSKTQPIVEGVYTVPRYDLALMLTGKALPTLLAELCSLDLSPEKWPAKQVLMTQVATISATLIQQPWEFLAIGEQPVVRLWCDGSYGVFMWETLTEIAAELAGGAVGLCQLKA